MQKNELDDFLGNLAEPEADPFQATDENVLETEAPAAEVADEGAADEKPLPFHKDPKVQRFIEKELNKRIAEFKPTESERFMQETRQEDSDEISDVLVRIIGNDTPEKVAAVKDFKKVLNGLEEKGAARAMQELQEQAAQSEQADRDAEEELDNGFESIEETFGVDLSSRTPQARKIRSEFIEYIERVAPKNADGEIKEFPDFLGTFESFAQSKKQAPAPNTRARDLASRSMARSSDASNAAPTTGKSWKDVDRIFSKLG